MKRAAFCELLKVLRRDHERWTRKPSPDSKQRKLYEDVATSFQVTTEGKLENSLRPVKEGQRFDLIADNVFLFMTPPADETFMLPILSLSGDLGIEELSVQLALFTLDSSGVKAAIGFRFETPHGDGRHNYHHVQMCRNFGKNGKLLPNVPWLPTKQPALLISATTPYSLFLGVLIGIYGLGELERICRGTALTPLGQDLKSLKEGCGCR